MPVSYGNCINAWIDSGGLYLQPTLIFRPFHPMLLLRWTQIQSIKERRTLFFRRIVVRMAEDVPELIFYGRLGSALMMNWRRLKPQQNS